jgi:hypothetical protein
MTAIVRLFSHFTGVSRHPRSPGRGQKSLCRQGRWLGGEMTLFRTSILGPAIAAILAVAATPCLADNEIIVNGGGIIKDGVGANLNKITFSVNVYADDGMPEGTGHFQARFHRLPLHPELEMSRFFSREITEFTIRPCTEGPCIFIKISAEGRLDGEEGWAVVTRMTDFGNPPGGKGRPLDYGDAIRISLFDPDGIHVYDTAWEGEFSLEQSWRHLLDGGNVSVHLD